MAQPALKKAHLALLACYPAVREDKKLTNFKSLASPMTIQSPYLKSWKAAEKSYAQTSVNTFSYFSTWFPIR